MSKSTIKNKDGSTSRERNCKESQFEINQQVSRLCMYFEARTPEDYENIYAFVLSIHDEIQTIDTLVFALGKVPGHIIGRELMKIVSKNDFTIFGQKRSPFKTWLNDHKFDMLISFVNDNHKKSRDIIKEARAKIKVGPNLPSNVQCFDITIGKPGERMKANDFYAQVKHYFSQLKINLNQ